MPKENLPFPAVAARSAKAGPKVCVVRLKVPRLESKEYVNPPEEEPRGKFEIWEPICWLTLPTSACVAASLGSSENTAVCATTPPPAGVVARTIFRLNV